MMYKVLLVNGCSVTQGFGMEGASNLEEARYGKIKSYSHRAWPQLLAHGHLNCSVLNMAQPGCGNDRILRTTMEETIGLLNQGYKPEELLVGIQWTYGARFEYPYEECSWDVAIPGYVDKTVKKFGCNVEGFWHSFGAKGRKLIESIRMNKIFDFMLLNEYYRSYNILRSISHMQNFLKSNGVPYFMFFNIHEVVVDFKKQETLSYLVDSLDWDKMFFVDRPEVEYCSFSDFCDLEKFPTSDDGHYLSEAHEEFTEEMAKWLRDNNYF